MRRRRLLILLLVLAALPVLGSLALRFYLASEWGRQQVESELAAAIGARVELGSVDAGLFATSLHDLRVYLPGDADTPTVAVEELRVSAPLWQLTDQNEILQHLVLGGAAVTLRFDRDGRILLQPPAGQGGGPRKLLARLENARVTLRQDGKPDLDVQGIRATIASSGDRLTLKGTTHDPSWGDWTVLALVDPETGAAKLQLKTDQVAITQERLEALPFIDAETWREITAEGLSPVEVTVWNQPPDGRAHYRVVVEPKSARLRVAAIDLAATEVAGKVTIEDGLIVLEDVRGRAAGGTLAVQANLDFRSKPEQLRFDITVADLDLRQLPRSWDLPAFLEGQLTGHAELGVELRQGGVRTTGKGQGQITSACIGGAAAAEPVSIHLVSQGTSFRFQTAPPRTGLSFRFASDLANAFADAVRHTGQPFVTASRSLVDWRLASRSDSRPPTFLRFHVDLKEVELGRFLSGIGIPLAIPVEGLAAIDVYVDLPVDTLNEPKCYRLDGTIRLPHLKTAGMEFFDVAGKLDYRDGVLRVADVAGRTGLNGLAIGSFNGSASLGLVPATSLQASMRLDGVPLPKSLADSQGLTGWLSGSLLLQAPLDRFGDTKAWEATIRLDDSRLGIANRTLAVRAEQIDLRNGSVSSQAITATLDGLEIAAAGSLGLARPHAFTLDLSMKDVEVDQLAKLLELPQSPVPVEGSLTGATHLKGTLEPLEFEASGRVTAAELQIDRLPLQRLEVDWKTDTRTLQIESFLARYSFGKLEGTAAIPIQGDQPGLVELQFHEIDLAPLARQLADLNDVEGRAFGTIRADVGRPGPDGRRAVGARIDFHLPRAKLQAIAGDRLQGSARFDGKEWTYSCDGEVLDGRLHVEGATTERLPVSKLTLEGAQLDRLRREMMRDPDSLPLHGRLDLELALRPENGERRSARGRLWLQHLHWQDSELAERIQADLQWRENDLILDNANGTFCRGLLRGRAVLHPGQLERSFFDLTLDRAEAQDLLIPWPDLAKHVTGTVEARLQTTMGRPWRTTGMVSLARGRLFGIDVAEWRVPVDLAFSPGSSSGELEIRDSHAQMARGRVTGQASYSWGHSNRLETKLRFIDANLHELIPAAADFNRLDGGTISGRLDLAGSNVTSLNDLTGTLDATLKQTQVFELPVFQQLAPYVAPQRSRRVPFDAGDIKARLAHGVVHLERLRLTGGVVHLLLEGSLSLQGRVDLDVTASTGLSAFQSSVMRRLGIDIPGSGPIPKSALARATSQLSARLIRLKVTGSVHNPQVQMVPLYQLTEEAVRFFLTGNR